MWKWASCLCLLYFLGLGQACLKLLIHHQKFPWVPISIETLTGTQGSSDNEPKVPEQVGHKVKGEIYPRTCHEHPNRVQTYRSNIYLNSEVEGIVSPTSRSDPFNSGEKIRYPLYGRLRGPQGRSGRMRTISLHTGVRSPDRPTSGESLYRQIFPDLRHSASNRILYIFFWVFPRRQIVVGRRFGTLYQFHLQRLGEHCSPSLWRWNWYRVPKRRPTTIWRRGNTQKKV